MAANNKKKAKNDVFQQESLGRHLKKYWQLYVMMLIPVIYYVIFRYVPMVGNIIAFRRYRAGSSIFGDEWSGLKYFNQFIKDTNFWRAFRNTLALNIKYLVISFPITIIFAILLNEIKNVHYKKLVQTISYLPHFISMVIVAGMIRELVSTSGPINSLIVSMGGEPIQFISLPQWFTTIFVTSGIWQGLGWGTILYLAAMSGINPELYEAASLDGANLLYQPTTYETADIIATYVYRMGLGSGNYSYATAVGLFQGLINIVLLTAANIFSKKTTGSGLY